MDATQRAYESTVNGLSRLRRRLVFYTCAGLLLQAATLAVALLLVAAGVESLLFLSPALRSALLLVVVAAPVAAVAAGMWRRLPELLSLRRLGLYVERRRPDLKQRLISTLELWTNPRAGRIYSRELLALTVSSAAALIGRIRARDIAELRPLRNAARNLAAALALALAALALAPPLREALHRVAHPMTPFARQPQTSIAVSPGDVEIVKGDEAVQVIRFGGRRPRTATIRSRTAGSTSWREEEIVVEGADSLVHIFKGLRDTLRFEVEAGDGRSATHRISVLEPPAVQRQRLRYHYPAYSRLPVRVEEGTGDLHALVGTLVEMEFVANKPLASAALVLDDTLAVACSVEDQRATTELVLARPGHYSLRLTDRQGIGNRNPIRHAIHVIEDNRPRVTVTAPGRDVDLTDDQQIVVAAEVADDFGISRTAIRYRINDGPRQQLALVGGHEREQQVVHTWDLSGTDLLPEDRVTYRVVAWDNDAVAGPKTGESREFVIRFPSLYELYEEVVAEQEEQLEQLEELVEEGRENREYLEQVRREVLKTEELSWEQQKELESTLESELERADALEELAREFEQTIDKLEENQLVPEQVLDVVEEIRRLMAEVTSPELRAALEAMQRATERLDPADLAEALQQFNESQDQFQERLDQTLALLQKVQAEQQLEAVAQQAADLHERQVQIDSKLAGGENTRHLQQHEERLGADAQRLEEQLEQLADQMLPLSPKTAQQLQAQADFMEQSAMSGRMQEMAARLQSAQAQQARRLGESLEGDLAQLSANLQQMKGEYVAGEKAEISGEMDRAVRDLVALSLAQEALQHRSDELGRDAAAALAEDQFALLKGTEQVTNQVGQLSRRTMSMSQALPVTLGRVLQGMQRSASALAESNTAAAIPQQRQAVQHLNEGALLLRESVENLEAARMPSSFAEAMEKMMGLSEQQADLNQATQQSMAPGRQPGQTGRQQPGFGEQMTRLAARQRQIYQALQELERSTRGNRGMQHGISEMQNEMESVLRDLNRRRPNQQTLHSQDRILQRMLETSRSIHSRGFEDKRLSRAGADGPYAGPGRLPEDLGQAEDLLRGAMKAALEGGYPGEYRAVIRQYYETMYQELTGQAVGAGQ